MGSTRVLKISNLKSLHRMAITYLGIHIEMLRTVFLCPRVRHRFILCFLTNIAYFKTNIVITCTLKRSMGIGATSSSRCLLFVVVRTLRRLYVPYQ